MRSRLCIHSSLNSSPPFSLKSALKRFLPPLLLQNCFQKGHPWSNAKCNGQFSVLISLISSICHNPAFSLKYSLLLASKTRTLGFILSLLSLFESFVSSSASLIFFYADMFQNLIVVLFCSLSTVTPLRISSRLMTLNTTFLLITPKFIAPT